MIYGHSGLDRGRARLSAGCGGSSKITALENSTPLPFSWRPHVRKLHRMDRHNIMIVFIGSFGQKYGTSHKEANRSGVRYPQKDYGMIIEIRNANHPEHFLILQVLKLRILRSLGRWLYITTKVWKLGNIEINLALRKSKPHVKNRLIGIKLIHIK